MSPVAVLVEHRDGEVTPPSLEALTLARALGTPVAVWLGGDPAPTAITQLARFGASQVRTVGDADRLRHSAVAAAAIAAATEDCATVLMVSTFLTKEIATRLAVITGAGVVVDAAGAELVDGHVVTEQTVFAATWNVTSRIATERAIVAIRPNTTQADPVDSPVVPDVVTVSVDLPRSRETVVAVGQVDQGAGLVLAEAPVVVAGGRGTGGDHTLVSAFAELLGGAVGASRDATDEGWISHEHMVGQTGVTVTPALYVACGISGAVHHRGGMQASGTIVSVNMDPDAPIFEISDFGVVGNLFDVLPQAMDTIRAHRAS